YDPMIAKLITYAETRDAAIEKMVRAIDDYKIVGIQTTLDFCKFAIQHEAFVSGAFDTKFVENYFTPAVLAQHITEAEMELLSALAVEFFVKNKPSESLKSEQRSAQESAWRTRLR
ncbi:MAG: biotin carboxylase, partial [Algoriphagus sp.]